MSNPRIRRLTLDYERLRRRFDQWAPIEVTVIAGDPPEQYRVVYHIRGLYSTPTGQIQERQEHVVEINLSLGYPRRAPQCKMITPIFHPNFDDVSVCIGDFWAASEGLDDLIVRIGRMIAYQEYNVRSPLNGLAAKWAAQNGERLPVDGTELAPPSTEANSGESEKIVVRVEPPVAGADVRFAPPADVAPAFVSFTLPAAAPQPVRRVPIYGTPVRNAPVVSNMPPRLPEEKISIPPLAPTPPVPEVSLDFLRLDFGSIAIALPPEKRLTFGSLPGNDIVLPYPSISGFHAEVIRQAGEVILRDLGSTKGTTKNSVAVTESRIVPGDRVSFGDVEAAVVSGF